MYRCDDQTMKQFVALFVLFATFAFDAPSLAEASDWEPLEILNSTVKPGEKARLSFIEEQSFIKEALDIQVLVARGKQPGQTLCLTAAVHGDEINGVEIARAVFESADPETLAGTLIAVPIVNVWGFRSHNRYVADRRDLNRAFPGSQTGSLPGRIAFYLFKHVILHCDALVDLHTGSDERINLPQIRADLDNPAVLELATRFDVGIVMAGAGPAGSLRSAANAAGVTSIIYEAGGPGRFEANEIKRGIEGVTNLMEYLGLIGSPPPTPDPQRVFRRTKWVRAMGGGIFLTDLALGDPIQKGDELGVVTDPITNQKFPIVAPIGGTLVGMAYPQVVLPGFGLFHIAGHDRGDVEPASDE
jgi:predicted deacylase